MINLLTSMKKKHDFLVCVDSDGCVFDNMNLKHQECFCPATVNVWELQNVSKYARQVAEFVNLYSGIRGANRFPALVRTLELLAERPEATDLGYTIPDLIPLKQWISETHSLSVKSLKEYAAVHPHPLYEQAIRWSEEVDSNIARIVRNVKPLPEVYDSLAFLSELADIVIVSATPHDAIVREWTEHNLIGYASVVAGQELGSKKACIAAANHNNKYERGKALMIGDAPGDCEAARANGVSFYPIVPGRERESWKRMRDEAADIFKHGQYHGSYEESRVSEFKSALPDTPNW